MTGTVSVLSDWLLTELKWCVKGHLRRKVAGDAGLGLALPVHCIFYSVFLVKRMSCRLCSDTVQHLIWQINTDALSWFQFQFRVANWTELNIIIFWICSEVCKSRFV